jgi:hypothetical protein
MGIESRTPLALQAARAIGDIDCGGEAELILRERRFESRGRKRCLLNPSSLPGVTTDGVVFDDRPASSRSDDSEDTESDFAVLRGSDPTYCPWPIGSREVSADMLIDVDGPFSIGSVGTSS